MLIEIMYTSGISEHIRTEKITTTLDDTGNHLVTGYYSHFLHCDVAIVLPLVDRINVFDDDGLFLLHSDICAARRRDSATRRWLPVETQLDLIMNESTVYTTDEISDCERFIELAGARNIRLTNNAITLLRGGDLSVERWAGNNYRIYYDKDRKEIRTC